jgi:hypothetical protein
MDRPLRWAMLLTPPHRRPVPVLVLFGPGRQNSGMLAGNFFASYFNHDYVSSVPFDLVMAFMNKAKPPEK